MTLRLDSSRWMVATVVAVIMFASTRVTLAQRGAGAARAPAGAGRAGAGGSVRQTRAAGAPPHVPAHQPAGGRDVVKGENGVAIKGNDGVVVAGDRGWVAAGNNTLAAGNGQGQGGAVNRSGEHVRWGNGNDWDDGTWDEDDWQDGYWEEEWQEEEWAEGGEGGYMDVGGGGGGGGDDESWPSGESWHVAAGAAAAIPVGTRFDVPPQAYMTVRVGDSPYYYSEGVWYEPVSDGAGLAYEVVRAPIGGVVPRLPSDCTGDATHQTCARGTYMKVAKGWQVVASR